MLAMQVFQMMRPVPSHHRATKRYCSKGQWGGMCGSQIVLLAGGKELALYAHGVFDSRKTTRNGRIWHADIQRFNRATLYLIR